VIGGASTRTIRTPPGSSIHISIRPQGSVSGLWRIATAEAASRACSAWTSLTWIQIIIPGVPGGVRVPGDLGRARAEEEHDAGIVRVPELPDGIDVQDLGAARYAEQDDRIARVIAAYNPLTFAESAGSRAVGRFGETAGTFMLEVVGLPRHPTPYARTKDAQEGEIDVVPPTPPQSQIPPEARDEVLWRAAMLSNARQTRGAARFIAWVVGLWVVASIIVGIVIGVQVAKTANELNFNGGTSSLCQSQGGPISGC
jgi:hypothetical protein